MKPDTTNVICDERCKYYGDKNNPCNRCSRNYLKMATHFADEFQEKPCELHDKIKVICEGKEYSVCDLTKEKPKLPYLKEMPQEITEQDLLQCGTNFGSVYYLLAIQRKWNTLIQYLKARE